MCPDDLVLAPNASNCLYVSQKHYRYWEWTRRLGTVRESAQRAACPFGGSFWQLWVNHTLAAAEASRRGAAHAVFAVCAPAQNDALLDGGRVLDGFRELLVDPATLLFIPLDALIDAIARVCNATQAEWAQRLAARYARI